MRYQKGYTRRASIPPKSLSIALYVFEANFTHGKHMLQAAQFSPKPVWNDILDF